MDYSDNQEMPPALTLSQLSRYVAQALCKQPILLGTWVVAEISDISSSGGHCYMTLLEKDATGVTVARMRATIWANVFYRLNDKFARVTGSPLSNGMKVMFYGGVNYHINYGMSFNIGEINPSYTLGDLERMRREILMALRNEGVIELNRNMKILDPVLNVAVISSEKAAGYGDFINQLHYNNTGVLFHTMLFPAVMQGEKTASSVLNALDLVEETHSMVNWDCVVVIRGGGSTTDMNGFDNLELARRVATFPIPVVVGIGHERDRCVLDEIACIRCKTPTAVAAWLIEFNQMLWERASDMVSRIATGASERLRGEHIRLQSLETMIPATAKARISNASIKLQSLSVQLPIIARNATSIERARIAKFSDAVRVSLRALLDKECARLKTEVSAMRIAIDTRLTREKIALENAENLIEVLSPASTIKRGYTITRLNGKALRNINDVKVGDNIETFTYDGYLTSQVIKNLP